MNYFMSVCGFRAITPERSGLVSAARTRIPAANYMCGILKYSEINHIASIHLMPVSLRPREEYSSCKSVSTGFFFLVVCRLQEQEQELNLAIKEATAKVSHFSSSW